MKSALVFGAMCLAASAAFAQSPQGGQQSDSAQAARAASACRRNAYNCVDAPNPLPAPNTVWLEEMTWMDVRDALAAGKTTVIIPSGGMEPNGPWLVTGKHNYVLQANCEAIARKLDNALCAPIIKLVPEGRIEPQTSHMVSPGTISLREDTYRAMLTDVVHSLKMHGFKNIILIGDSGGNQSGQRYVADSLTKIWNGTPVVAHIQEYYDYNKVGQQMASKIVEDSVGDGLHDDPVITLNMFMTDPKSVRYEERVKAKKATINGFSIADKKKNAELGKEIVALRTESTVEAIHKSIANKGTLPAPPRPPRGQRQQPPRPPQQ
jgi:creatinine amidohydrolase/Fe(II)-dependent formamide hydrolase-like protein